MQVWWQSPIASQALGIHYFGACAAVAAVILGAWGDRNLTNGLPITEGILLLVPNRPIGWTQGLHYPQGNIALADGSVQSHLPPSRPSY